MGEDRGIKIQLMIQGDIRELPKCLRRGKEVEKNRQMETNKVRKWTF